MHIWRFILLRVSMTFISSWGSKLVLPITISTHPMVVQLESTLPEIFGRKAVHKPRAKKQKEAQQAKKVAMKPLSAMWPSM